MGETELVTGKFAELRQLARLLEASEPRPLAIVYAAYSDTGVEALLVVPATITRSSRENYRRIAQLISHHRNDLPSIDIADVRVVAQDEPYIRGLSSHLYVSGFSTITIAKSVFDGIYVEYAVVFLLMVERQAKLAS